MEDPGAAAEQLRQVGGAAATDEEMVKTIHKQLQVGSLTVFSLQNQNHMLLLSVQLVKTYQT